MGDRLNSLAKKRPEKGLPFSPQGGVTDSTTDSAQEGSISSVFTRIHLPLVPPQAQTLVVPAELPKVHGVEMTPEVVATPT